MPVPLYAQFLTVPTNVQGLEDNPIPLNIVVDPVLTDGGPQFDLLASESGFRDAADTLPTTFTIPADTVAIRVTGYGGNDNATLDDREEDYHVVSLLVSLEDGVFSGTVFSVVGQSTSSNDDYSFSQVPLGSASTSGAIVGDNDDGLSAVTVDVSGSTLSITDSTSLFDQAYLVEYLTNANSSSRFLRASGQYLASLEPANPPDAKIPAVLSRSMTLNANTRFLTLAITGGQKDLGWQHEDKTLGRVVVDLDTRQASGVLFAHKGRSSLQTAAYAFSDYDIDSGNSILSDATVVGDTNANAGNLPDWTISEVAGTLTMVRPKVMGDNFTSMVNVEEFARFAIGSNASSLGSSATVATYIDDPDVSNTFDVVFPGSAKFGNMSITTSNISANSTFNENSGVANIVFDIANETTSGSFLMMRTTSPDLVSWSNVPFGMRVFDHPDTVSNRTALTLFQDEFAGTLSFSRVRLPDGSDVIRGTLESTTYGDGQEYRNYQFGVYAVWSGRFGATVSGIPNGGSFSHGAIDASSGNLSIDPADLANLAFTPNADFSGQSSITLDIDYRSENHPVDVAVVRVADAPVLTIADPLIVSSTTLDLSSTFDVALSDTDGSETLSSIVLSGLPSGDMLTDGVSSVTSDGVSSQYDIASWNHAQLSYVVGDLAPRTISVVAQTRDTDGFSATDDIAQQTASFTIALDPAADFDGDGVANSDESNLAETEDPCLPSIGNGACLDSDGDGFPDFGTNTSVTVEPNASADNEPCVPVIGGTSCVDTDGDGFPDSTVLTALPKESNVAGDADPCLPVLGGTNCADSDGDGFPDFSVTTGLPKETSALGDNEPCDPILGGIACPDTDGDGFPDFAVSTSLAKEPNINADSDPCVPMIGVPNCSDSDGDGFPDFSVTTSVAKEPDSAADSDPCLPSVGNSNCLDSDGDGYPDFSVITTVAKEPNALADADPCIPEVGSATCADSDGDGYPDFSVITTVAKEPSVTADSDPCIPMVGAPNCSDTDGDGFPDASVVTTVPKEPDAASNTEPCVPLIGSVSCPDSDSDGYPDFSVATAVPKEPSIAANSDVCLPNPDAVSTEDCYPPTITSDTLPLVTESNIAAYVVAGACTDTGDAVTVTIGSESQNGICNAGRYSFVFDLSPLNEGVVALDASISDAKYGQVSDSQLLIIDRAPTVSFAALPIVDAGNQAGYTVSGSCTAVGDTLTLEVAGIQDVVACDTGGVFEASMDLRGLTQGAYSISAYIDDGVNTVVSGVETVTVDAPPTIDASAAVDITPLNASLYGVEGLCDAPGDSIALRLTDLFMASVDASTTCQPNGSYSLFVNASSLADGLITVQTTVSDSNGNNSDAISIQSVQKAPSPSITLSSLVPIAAANEDAYVVEGSCYDVGDAIDIILSDGSASVVESTTCNSSGQFVVVVDTQLLSEGAIGVDASIARGPLVDSDSDIVQKVLPPTLTLDPSNSLQPGNAIDPVSAGAYTVSGDCESAGDTIELVFDDGRSTVISSTMCGIDGRFEATVDVQSLVQTTVVLSASINDGVNPAVVETASIFNDTAATIHLDTPVPLNGSNEATYPISGWCSAAGDSIVVSASDDSMPTNTVTGLASCSALGVLNTTLDLSTLVGSNILIGATISDVHGSASDSAAAVRASIPSVRFNTPNVITEATIDNFAMGGSCYAPGDTVTVTLDDGVNATAAIATNCLPDGRFLASGIDASLLAEGAVGAVATLTDASMASVTTVAAVVVDRAPTATIVAPPITPANAASYRVEGACTANGDAITVNVMDEEGTAVEASGTCSAGSYSVPLDVSILDEHILDLATVTVAIDDGVNPILSQNTTVALDSVPVIDLPNLPNLTPANEDNYTVFGDCSAPGDSIFVTVSDTAGAMVRLPETGTVICEDDGTFVIGGDLTGLSDGLINVSATIDDGLRQTSDSYQAKSSDATVTLALDTVISDADAANYMLGGFCFPVNEIVQLQINGSPLSTSCDVGGVFSATVDVSAAPNGNIAITAAIDDGVFATSDAAVVERDRGPSLSDAALPDIVPANCANYALSGFCDASGDAVQKSVSDGTSVMSFTTICQSDGSYEMVVNLCPLDNVAILITGSVDDGVNPPVVTSASVMSFGNDQCADLLSPFLDCDGDGIANAYENGVDLDGSSGDDVSSTSGRPLETSVSGAGSSSIYALLLMLVAASGRITRLFGTSPSSFVTIATIRNAMSHIARKLVSKNAAKCIERDPNRQTIYPAVRAVSLAVLCIVPSASAEPSEPQTHSRYCAIQNDLGQGEFEFASCWYLGAGYGLSHVKPRGLSGNGWFTGDDSDSGYVLNVGWRFKPRWFAELQYADLGAAGLSNTDPNREQAIPNAEISYKVPSLMVGYRAFEWWDQFSVYGKLGVASIENKPVNGKDANLANPVNSIDFEEQTSTQIVGGLGLEWQPRNSRWFARLNYDSFDKDAAFVSLSINAYLGRPNKFYGTSAGLVSDHEKNVANSGQSAGAIAGSKTREETLTTYIESRSARAQALVQPEQDVAGSDIQTALDGSAVSAEKTCTLPDLGPVYFASNRWGMSDAARDKLSQYAAFLKDNRAVAVELVGHADGSGASNVNEQIARQRSRHVYRHLLSLEVDKSQLRTASVADSQPVASNATVEGRAANRRVELRSTGCQ